MKRLFVHPIQTFFLEEKKPLFFRPSNASTKSLEKDHLLFHSSSGSLEKDLLF